MNSGSTVIFDRVLKESFRIVRGWFFQGLDDNDFLQDVLDQLIFQGCIGWWIFQGLDSWIFQGLDGGSFKDWIVGSFKDWMVDLSRIGYNGYLGFGQWLTLRYWTRINPVYIYFSAFSKNCLHIIVTARGSFITMGGYKFVKKCLIA
jgi:hypothetical protein